MQTRGDTLLLNAHAAQLTDQQQNIDDGAGAEDRANAQLQTHSCAFGTHKSAGGNIKAECLQLACQAHVRHLCPPRAIQQDVAALDVPAERKQTLSVRCSSVNA